MSESSSTQTNGSSPGGQSFPLFYKKPEPLRSDVHADVHLQPAGNYGFARTTNSIPLTIGELPLAARHYPIVFVGKDNPMPVAIVGLRKDENLMVADDGTWDEGLYIPAYVRRYPFAFVQDSIQNKFALCLDFSSDMVSTDDGIPLFQDGEPSEITQKALKFCEALQQQVQATQAVGKALADNGLLETNKGQFTLEDGEKLGLAGLNIVSDAKLRELSDEAFLGLRSNGALGAIICHQVSLHNWRNLVRLA